MPNSSLFKVFPKMKSSFARFVIVSLFLSLCCEWAVALPSESGASASQKESDSITETPLDSAAYNQAEDVYGGEELAAEPQSFHKILKTKFIEGDASFMSVIALALVIGLAFCIERIVYLNLSEIDTRRFMRDLDEKMSAGDLEGAVAQCKETRGPVASICREGLERVGDRMENIERAVSSFGSLQAANLEKGCSWITMLIVMAPSLGFLGTVVGIVIAFGQIQLAGDISPTIVASGMKVALITTIFGIIVALVLQLFYNYILSKIDSITSQMEESAITLLDVIAKYKEAK